MSAPGRFGARIPPRDARKVVQCATHRCDPARRHAGLLAGVVLLALSGCMTIGPDYARPVVELPKSHRATMPGQADVLDTAWWDAFGDPALSGLVKAGLAANADLLVAAHRIERLEARLQVSNAARYPRVGYDGRVQNRLRSQEQPALLGLGRFPQYDNIETLGTFSWEIDIWGKVARANEAARAELLAGEEARRAVMLKMVSAVVSAYAKLLARDQLLMLAREQVDNRRAQLELAREKQKGGSGTLIEVSKLETALQESMSELPPIEQEIALLEHELQLLVGRTPGPVARGTLSALRTPPVPAGLPSDLLSRRPDVAAAEQALVAANAMIGVAKAQYFPTISLTGMLGLQSDQLRWLLARTARTHDYNAGLVGTLFSAGRIEGEVKEAEAKRRELAQSWLQSVQTALREVDDALVSRSKAEERAAIIDQQVGTVGEVVRLARLRHEGGRATLLDVLELEQHRITVLEEQVRGQHSRLETLIGLYKAMGGGWMARQDGGRPQVTAATAPPGGEVTGTQQLETLR